MNIKTGVFFLLDCTEAGLVTLWETRKRVVTRGPGPRVAEGELVSPRTRTRFQGKERAMGSMAFYRNVFQLETRGPREGRIAMSY